MTDTPPERNTLYSITTRLAELEAAIIEAGGVIDDEAFEADYAEALAELDGKAENYIRVIRNAEAEAHLWASRAETFEDEAGRLRAHEKAARRTVDTLEARMLAGMQLRGETKHVTDVGTITIRTSGSRSVVLTVDIDELPEQYRTVRVSADKRAIASDLKAGDALAATVAYLDEPKQSLNIR